MNAAFGWLHGKRCSCDAAGLGEIMLDVQQQVREVTKMYRPLNLAIQSRPLPLAQGASF